MGSKKPLLGLRGAIAPCLSTVLAVTLATPGRAPGQGDFVWIRKNTGSQVHPGQGFISSGFCNMSLAHDRHRSSTVTYAPPGPSGATTFEWDGNHWTQLPSNVVPLYGTPAAQPQTYDTRSVYDSVRQVTVLYGVNWQSQIFEFDGLSWTFRPTSSFPAAATAPVNSSNASLFLEGAHLAFDVNANRTVLFGGSNNGSVARNETWLWDGTGQGAWTQAQPTLSPPARSHGAMVFDEANQRVLLFGGIAYVPFSPPTIFADTWEWQWTGTAPEYGIWTPLSPSTTPFRRYGHAMAYDPARQRTVLYGGRQDTNPATPPLGDAWEFDRSANGGTWRQLTSWNSLPAYSALPSPSDRWQCEMAYDVRRSEMLVCGGNELTTWPVSPDPPETWVMVFGLPPASASTFGNGCSTSTYGIPDLQAATLPRIGTTFDAHVDHAAPGATIFCIGWSHTNWLNFPLPLPLGPFGLDPNCTAYTSSDVVVWVIQGTGVADYTLPIPLSPSFAGATLYFQAASLDFALPSAMPIATSNGLRAILGF